MKITEKENSLGIFPILGIGILVLALIYFMGKESSNASEMKNDKKVEVITEPKVLVVEKNENSFQKIEIKNHSDLKLTINEFKTTKDVLIPISKVKCNETFVFHSRCI